MKKGWCFFLAVLLVISCAAVPVSAAGQEKASAVRNIAIVFDNSGSMYADENKAWCRATYAMEVFAAMMNQGDTLSIHPMHEVTIDGKRYDSANPVVVSGPKNAEIIRRIYTPDALGTPIETIDAAYNSLARAKGERWLIVLTDGDSFYENDQDLGGSATAEKLTERLGRYNRQVNVMYLGIGSGAAMPSVKDGGAYRYYGDKAGDSGQVLSKLVYMCNIIFGRDTMPVSGNTLDLDLSMKKVIVFVQGKNVSNISAKNASGDNIGSKTEEHGTRYSNLGAGGYNGGNSVDENLQGMIVTFENCRAGEYTLSYSGDASSAVAYYEPDVDLVVRLVEASTGNIIGGDETAYAGQYTLSYGLKDNQTGELTESELLGDTHYEVRYTVNGQEHTASSDKKRDELTVSLEPGDVLDATITADYLSGYHIEKAGPDFGWPEGGFKIEVRTIDIDQLEADVSGMMESYSLSELEKDGAFTLTASYNGEPLTGELLGRVEPHLSVEGGDIDVTWEPNADLSGFDCHLKYHEDAQHTRSGDYKLSYGISYTNEDAQTGQSRSREIPFTVLDDGYGLEAELEASQTYYRLSAIEEGEPLILRLSKDAQPLTDEELRNVKVELDTGGIPYDAQPVSGQSSYSIRLRQGDDITTGKHDITCTAAMRNNVGREVSAEAKTSVEVQKYPLWLRWAVLGLALLLVLLVIWLIMNQKVLPKHIKANGETDFNIGGKTVEDNAKLGYKRQSKTLDISPPSAPAYPYVSCAAKLKLEPVSPRRVPSARRQAAVTEVVASNDISSVEVGASVYERDSVTGKFVKEGSAPTIISSNSVVTVNGTAQTNKGKKKTAILSQQLRFK
ncbi:MAG: VWA domain-containing protein [Oscillospiraceae bacterium]|nr:VWA domain-containing protein [Oscillospiraceae bacterium]